ncbi:hypothetical protein MNBD_GAMMA09-2005 [hydrothermal vent metagenome]|uniref:Transposase n=1 Tax=hydrothermal vent metagenome TaxID=652676 RepID=A0A3B0YMN2_9ZZZZ
MKTQDIQALAAHAAKNIKSEHDLNEFKQLLTKMTLEAALNTELDEHLGYDNVNIIEYYQDTHPNIISSITR